MAKLRAHHDWNFADGDLVFLKNGRLRLENLLSSLGIPLAILELLDLDVAKDFCLVSQSANPSRVRHDWLVGGVSFVQTGKLVDGGLPKDHFKGGLLVILAEVLAVLGDGLLPKLSNDLLDRVLEEALEGENLLGHQTILLEVAVDDLPAIVLVDGVAVQTGDSCREH